jgi:dipeptidyl aminopeptidase/acylaminoacyl peptidase
LSPCGNVALPSLARASLALTLVAAFVGAAEPNAQAPSPTQRDPDTSWIDISAPLATTPHAMSVDDILSLREVRETAISPNGQSVAFLVRQAFRVCNCYRTALYTTQSSVDRSPKKLLEENQLLNLRWSPDGRLLTFLSNRGGPRQVWRIEPTGDDLAPLFFHAPRIDPTLVEALGQGLTPTAVGVDQYEWSPDGSKVAFVAQHAADSSQKRQLTDNGVVYDDESMWVFDLLRKSWVSPRLEVWTYDVRETKERLVWQGPTSGVSSKSAGIWGLAWSPGGDSIAFGYPVGISRASGWMNHEIGLLTVSTGRFDRLTYTDTLSEGLPAWSADGRQLAYVSVRDWDRAIGTISTIKLRDRQVRRFAARESGVLVPWLAWEQDTALLFEATVPRGDYRQRSGIYRINLRSQHVQRVTDSTVHISMCSALIDRQTACVRQRPDVPADPTLVDVASGETRQLASVNPQLQETTRSPVKELRWLSAFGVASNGYLLLPSGYVRGERYPLVVILYGFQGRFIAAAEWLTSYPAQVFAQQGFAVLLCNPPGHADKRDHPPADGRYVYGYSPLASIEAGVKAVVHSGVADPARVGIMGWSYGGYLVQFALSHSTQFRVGAVGNGGGWSLGSYWYFGSRAHRQFYERVVGGPPYGSTIGSWLRFFPSSRPSTITAPLLMEFDADEAVAGLEMYTGLRREGTPVEFVIYPDESHVFSQPTHRVASMQRNLDWFAFWLLGRAPRPGFDAGRAERWRAMRALSTRQRSRK